MEPMRPDWQKFKVGDIVWWGGRWGRQIIPRSQVRIIRAKQEWLSYDAEIVGKEHEGWFPVLCHEVEELTALDRLAWET